MTTTELTDALWGALLPMQRLAWEQGVASQAAVDSDRLDLALAMARDAVAHADADGRLAATGDDGLVNGGALGEAVSLLARTGDADAAAALERQRWWFLRYSPRDDEGVVWHLADRTEVWVDSIYMVVPLLVLTGDVAPADMQYRMHREHLWNEATGLYSHRVNTVTGERVRDEPWASGNGWAAAGMARALHIGGEALPTEMSKRWQGQHAGPAGCDVGPRDSPRALPPCARRSLKLHRRHRGADVRLCGLHWGRGWVAARGLCRERRPLA